MAEHKYGQPMVAGQNLNDAAEDYYVLKLGEWKKKNKLPAVTIYYRSTEYNLHSETYIDEENKVHFVVNYWGECFFSHPAGHKYITVVPRAMSRLLDFGEMDMNLLRCYEL